jgi:UDP:flavonoid glycosyltransferase YjiC (YdhE family)
VLEDPTYAAAAKRLQDEIAVLPDPATAVPLLERLATERRDNAPESGSQKR